MTKSEELPKWDRDLYPENAKHHRKLDDWFFAQCPDFVGNERMLDLGCGSGEFTAKVGGMVPDGSVLGLDASDSLISSANDLGVENVSFVVARMQDLSDTLAGQRFSAIVSRAAMHWIPKSDHAAILCTVADLLEPKGWAQFEFGGAGNIPRMLELLNEESDHHGGTSHPWYFPNAGEYMELCQDAGLDAEIRTVSQRRAFTKDEVLGWMRSQALQAYESSVGDGFDDFSAAALNRVDEVRRADGSHDLTYVRCVATLRKSSV